MFSLLLCTPIHAMNDWWVKHQQEKEFKEYFNNGNLWACEERVTDDRIQRVSLWHLLSDSVTISSDDFITALRKKNVTKQYIAHYYAVYQKVLKNFVEGVIAKQVVLQRMKQKETNDKFDILSELFKNIQFSMIYDSKWLSAIRKSGVEHVLCVEHGVEHDNNRMGNSDYFIYRNTSNHGIETVLWESSHGLKKVLLDDWFNSFKYLDRFDKAWSNASPTSMAIIRHQLYKGFKKEYAYNHISSCYTWMGCYKKTTEYTGDPICRVTLKGKKACNWPYEKLEYLLALADKKAQEEQEYALDTELLWRVEEPQKETEPNNLLLGINGWRDQNIVT